MAKDQYPFLSDGEMGGLIRSYNWSQTSVGAIEDWPVSLRVQVSMMLKSRFPMLIFWGADLITFYNDAFRPSLGEDGKHPGSLGQRGEESWAESWPVIGPMIYNIMGGGEAVWFEDQKLPIYRDGQMGYAYWTYSFSPIVNDEGAVNGILVTCSETTKGVESLMLLNATNTALEESKEQLEFAIDATELGVWDLDPATGRFTANERLKEWFGLRPDEEIPLTLATDVIVEKDRQRVNEAILRAMQPDSGGKYDTVYAIRPPGTNAERIVRGKGRAWFGDDGACYRFNGTLQDITEPHTAVQQLGESEAKLRAIVETSPAAIGVFVGPDMVIEELNQTFVDFVGKDWTIQGRPLREALPELVSEDQPFLQILNDVYAKGIPFNAPSALVKLVHNGELVDCYYNLSYTPLRNAEGAIYAILAIAVDVTAQVAAQQIIADKSRELERAMDVGELGSFKIDLVAQVGIYTERMMNWFGLEGLEVPMQDIFARIHPEDQERVSREIAATMEGANGGSHDIIYRVVGEQDGGIRYLHSTGQVRQENGQPISITGIIQDVTEETTSREVLKRSEERFRQLIEEAPFATALYVGESLKVDIANEAMISLWGKTPAVVGMPLAHALPELEGQPFIGLLQEVLRTGVAYESKEQHADLMVGGQLQRFWFNFTYKPIRDNDGKVYAILNMAVDVTRQVMGRREIEESEKSLAAAIALAQLGTWHIDLIKQTVSYSDRLREWLGISGSVLNLAASPRVHPEDRERIGQALKATMEQGTAGHFDEVYRIVHAQTGQVRTIHASGRVEVNEEGQPVAISGTAQDVTIQKDLQAALEQEVQTRTEELAAAFEELQVTNEELAESNDQLVRSNEELAQYAYVASHDLQEPLRKIQVFTNLLGRDTTIHPKGREYIDKVTQSAQRMTLLIKDLLEFSRLLRADTIHSLTNLNKVVVEVYNDFELAVSEKHAVLRLDSLPTIEAVSLQMNQLFYNLVSNALKFSKPGVPPEINIRSEEIAGEELRRYIDKPLSFATYYRICVADNGIGFEAQYNDQIFEVFKRLHGRDTYPGSGIGLALCRRIVANHGGMLYTESTPGEGSIFCVILPDRQQEATGFSAAEAM